MSISQNQTEVQDERQSAVGATASKAAGEVQENPAAARVGVEDADCQRGSEASVPPHRVT